MLEYGIKADDKTKWFLEAVEDANREWMVAVEPVPFIVGRDEDCDLKLTAKGISRHHVEIRRSGDHLWIRDLGSKNGTFVNHQKLQQAELLEDGDIISIGKFKFCLKSIESDTDSMTETDIIDISKDFDSLASLEPKIRALLADRNVIPYFQPILKFSDRTVVGYEILGRIADQDLPASPAELLEIAQWIGCATELSALFREAGVEIGNNLPGSPILFVNTTPMEVNKPKVLLQSLKRMRKLSAGRIVLEINEKAITDTDELLRLRQDLQKLDMGLAFDDFGAGQTRLVELAEAPPDYLKFDTSLVHQIHLAPMRLHQMVSTFVKAARDLGIATVAEGIECDDEAETCRQLGFDFAQGYLFGRPLPIEEITQHQPPAW